MNKATTHEQRSAERIYCKSAVRLRTSDDREISGVCTDFNGSGIGIETETVLVVGQRLDLLLQNDHVQMMVIYRMGKHYGLASLGSHARLMELLPRN